MSSDYITTSRTFFLFHLVFQMKCTQRCHYLLRKYYALRATSLLAFLYWTDYFVLILLMVDHYLSHAFALWVSKFYGVHESWNSYYILNQWGTTKAMPKYRFVDGEVLFCLKYIYFLK